MWPFEWIVMFGYGALIGLWLVLLLILRFHWVEKIFKGFPRAYRLHHMLGILVLIFAVIHGFLSLSEAWDLGPWYALLAFWFDPADRVSLSGSFAVLSLFLIVGAAFLKRLNRRPWLWIHRSSLLSLGLVLWHGYELDVLSTAGAWSLGLWLLGVGLFLILSLHLLGYVVLQYPLSYVVSEVVSLGPQLYELTLATVDRRWQPGHFGFFRFFDRKGSGVSRERHPFTVLRRDSVGQMILLIKAVGDDTTKLQQVTPGTRGDVQGPYGTFLPAAQRQTPQVWLAGGIGVIPFMGVLQTLRASSSQRPPITLVLFIRPGGITQFQTELDQWSKDHPWFHWFLIEDDPQSPSGIGLLESLIPSWRTADFLVAGPHGMVEYWSALLHAGGLPRRRIHTEDFLK